MAKIIATLKEEDIYPSVTPTKESDYTEPRNSVRVVIFDEDGCVALGFVKEDNGNKRYSMIGGGVDEGESVEDACSREALEEAGCKIKNVIEMGIIEERGIGSDRRGRFIQTNYCFLAQVDGMKNEPHFTEDDIKDGLGLIWLPLDTAITNLEQQQDTFITRKTLILLNEAKRLAVN